MDEKKTISEQIEESLRICEELFSDAPEGIPEKPEIDLDEILNDPVVSAGSVSHSEPENGMEHTKIWKPEQVNRELEEQTVRTVNAPQEEKKKPKVELTPEPESTEKRSVRSIVISLLVCVLIAVAAAVLITKFVANHTTVEGSSMEPCLQNKDELIVEKISYLTGEPERFDVVVFKFNEDTKYIKRIIGLPGEMVRIEEGKIYINDRAIFDQYANGVMENAGIAEKTITLGEEEYFVLGDNRNASKDSRDEEVGTVKKDQIIGKAWLRVMPFDSFGTIE